jgi:hypothetical protein
MRHALTLSVVVMLGCSGTPGKGGDTSAGVRVGESASAAAVLQRVEQLFPPGAAAQGHAAVPRIGLAQVDHFERAADGLRPSFAAATSRAAHHPASVVLPPTADGAVRLRDLDSHLGIALQLDGARPVPVVVAKGMAVYPGAHPSGADVMHRVSMHGTEDFLSIPNGTGGDHIDYHVTLEPSVAGLRLSQNVLEFIDAGGTPRMRVAPPYLIDQKGRTHSATLSVSGCAVDTSTAQPWGRAAVPPGAAICQVTVRWDSAKVAYPILLDPSWTTTGSLVVGRAQHTANLITVKANQIPKQMVLIAGGVTTGGTNTTQSAELYDIESRTFSLTGGLGGTPDDPDFQSRAGHTATTRQDGQRVLLVGGNRHTPDNPFDLVQASPRLYIPQGFNGTSGGNDNPLAGV